MGSLQIDDFKEHENKNSKNSEEILKKMLVSKLGIKNVKTERPCRDGTQKSQIKEQGTTAATFTNYKIEEYILSKANKSKGTIYKYIRLIIYKFMLCLYDKNFFRSFPILHISYLFNVPSEIIYISLRAEIVRIKRTTTDSHSLKSSCETLILIMTTQGAKLTSVER